MDFHGAALAASGLLLGWWINRGEPPKEPGPCQCHCACALPEIVVHRESSSAAWWVIGTFVVGLVLVTAALALALIIKRSPDSSEQVVGFSFKGGYGKGKYGAERGLQILDQ